MENNAKIYTDDNIKVLEGLEAVRKRPGMYIGTTDTYGLHHLVWEIFDNSVDEVLSGNANLITITLFKDNSISVSDNGRGIPTGINKSTKKSTIDTVFTILHAGGKFEEGAYKTSGGLHGVGSSVVNALSEWMHVTVSHKKEIWESKYANGGNIVQPSTKVANTIKSGTTVHFLPDKKIFKSYEFNPTIISDRVKEATYLFNGLKVLFIDKINKTEQEFHSKHGIKDYVEFINDNKTTISDAAYFSGSNLGINVEVAFQYTTSNSETILSFANSVKTKEGGTHEGGFRTALTESFNNFARANNLIKDKSLDGSDIREGLTAVISVFVPENLIVYEGQTKNKLFTQEALTAVKKIANENLTFWLQENKKVALTILEKALLAREARLAAKKAREAVRKLKDKKTKLALSGKLTPAQLKDPINNEIFLVEGDSAGGSAKLGRDKKHQAILPLKGKIINAERAKITDLLHNEEISTIIACLGCGIKEDFKLKDLKYHKVIIMTDADTDGAHIQTLLLTFFYRFMRPLIEAGHVFVALAPLYKITNKNSKKFAYAWDDIELDQLKKEFKSYEIQRYKGLGEMNAEQLKETTMNKHNRRLIQVHIDDIALSERRVSTLMGDNVEPRKEWIVQNVDFSLED